MVDGWKREAALRLLKARRRQKLQRSTALLENAQAQLVPIPALDSTESSSEDFWLADKSKRRPPVVIASVEPALEVPPDISGEQATAIVAQSAECKVQ